ncbi:hypothetical protein Tco_0196749 [Tanacetum coccineum]
MIGTLLYLTASRLDLHLLICMCPGIINVPTAKHLKCSKKDLSASKRNRTSGPLDPKDSPCTNSICNADHAGCLRIHVRIHPWQYTTFVVIDLLMALSIADQIALDDALVAPADRLKIGKCNLRLSSDVTSKEATLQVVYDVLKLTPFYKAFKVTADAPEIYMQEF